MPKIFNESHFCQTSETVAAYVNKHSPYIVCEPTAKRGQKFKVTIRIGKDLIHPNTTDHYFAYVQLWDLEKLLVEARFSAGVLGDKPTQTEVDFYIVPKVSMRLTAHAYCTKHGLWKSEEVFVKVTD